MVGVSCLAAVSFALAAARRRGRACMRMRPRLSRPSRHGAIYIEAFALNTLVFATLFAAMVFVWDYDSPMWEILTLPLHMPELVALGYAFASIRSLRDPLSEWGWRRGYGFFRELSVGVLAGLILWLVRPLLAAFGDADESPWLSVRSRLALGTVVLAPVLEETLYRGALYRYMRDRLHWLSAAIFSSTVFALAHSFPQMHAAYVLGLACALLREWRGSLIAPIAAHASWNALCA